jgi:hypothetical protein
MNGAIGLNQPKLPAGEGFPTAIKPQKIVMNT